MRQALLIFQKDVRHLWPRLAPVLVLTALLGWLEIDPFRLIGDVAILWQLSWVYLAASVIHEEHLPGHRQYWLTRPYHRRHLLLSKALFVAVFAFLPQLIIEAISLSVNGVSPLRHIALLFTTALASVGVTILAAVALASVTENLVQLLWGLLPVIGIGVLAVMFVGRVEWGGVEEIRASALSIVMATAAVAVILLQYAQRRTAVSRAILGSAFLIVAAGQNLGAWHAAWAIQSKLSAGRGEASEIRISFDPSRPPAVGFAEAHFAPRLVETGINLPISIAGLPAAMELVSERIAVSIESPGGQSWTSIWTPIGGITSGKPFTPRVISEDGPCWQYMNIDRAFYETVKDVPVRLHAFVALTLLSGPQTAALATLGRTGKLPGEGICVVYPGPFEKLMVFCAWPGGTPGRSYVKVRSRKSGQSLESLLAAGPGSSYLGRASVWSLASALSSPLPQPFEMELETRQVAARFQHELDIPQIRLRDYAVRRITDPQ